MYTWDGQGFVKPAYGDIVEAINGWGNARQYTFTQDTGRFMHLVWWENTGSEIRIVHTYCHPEEGVWSAKAVVDAPNTDEIQPMLTAKGQGVYCFYHKDNTSGIASLYGKKWDGATRQWSAALEIARPTTACRFPQTVQKTPASSPFIPVVWTEGVSIKYCGMPIF